MGQILTVVNVQYAAFLNVETAVRFMQLQYQGTVHVKNNINKVGQSLLNFLYDLAQNDIMWLQLLLKLDFQQTEKIVC